MKTILKPLLSILSTMVLTTGDINAQTSLEARIKLQEQKVVNAILQNDTNALKQLWAPEFMVTNPRNNISPDRNAVLLLQKAGMINYSIFEKVVEQVQVQNNTVISMGHETIVSRTDIPGMKAGQTYKRRFTNVWMKKKGRWQQVARHASIICN